MHTITGKLMATTSLYKSGPSAPMLKGDRSAQVHHHPTRDKSEKEIGTLGENRRKARATSEEDRVSADEHHEQLPSTLWRRSRWGEGGLRWKTKSG